MTGVQTCALPILDLSHAGGVVEAILARLEIAAFEGAEEIEAELAADDAAVLELLGDDLGLSAWGDVDEGFGMRAERGVDDVASDGCGKEEEQKQGPEKLQGACLQSGSAQCTDLRLFYFPCWVYGLLFASLVVGLGDADGFLRRPHRIIEFSLQRAAA